MKKLIVTMVAAFCLAGTVVAQDGSEFTDLQDWLLKNTNGKDAFYEIVNPIRDRVTQEFPIDAELQKTLDALMEEQNKAVDAKVKEFGYTSLGDDRTKSDDALTEALNEIFENYQIKRMDATRLHDEEFERRFQAAFIEAVKKFQENAATMSK